MISVALKMLIGNKAAFIGVIFGIFLAVLLISQQSAIFLGLLSRSYRVVSDNPLPNMWVIDPSTQGEDVIRGMPKDYLGFVRNVPGIEWAMPINFGQLPVILPSGIFKVAEIYGVDDETLFGAPKLIQGNIDDLHGEDGVVIDSISAKDVKMGDILEINGRRAVIVGIGTTTPGFYPQPILFMTNNQFQKYSGSNRIQYIAAQTNKETNISTVLDQIDANPNLIGLTGAQMKKRMADHFLKTGILINFGLSVLLGMIIGFSIAGQIFYMMTIHNLSYYALIKALGGTDRMILIMIITQALIAGTIGYLLGTGATLLWGFAVGGSSLAFEFPWQLLVLTGTLALIICVFTACLSIKKVIKLDPHILMTTT